MCGHHHSTSEGDPSGSTSGEGQGQRRNSVVENKRQSMMRLISESESNANEHGEISQEPNVPPTIDENEVKTSNIMIFTKICAFKRIRVTL